MENKKKKRDNIFKAFFREITDTIIGEIIVNILLFIPRMICSAYFQNFK